jgi:hypothetical protein
MRYPPSGVNLAEVAVTAFDVEAVVVISMNHAGFDANAVNYGGG